MHIGFDNHCVEVATGVIEANTGILDFEGATDLSKDVEKGHHLLLARATDEDVALGCERRCRPGCRLVAVE